MAVKKRKPLRLESVTLRVVENGYQVEERWENDDYDSKVKTFVYAEVDDAMNKAEFILAKK